MVCDPRQTENCEGLVKLVDFLRARPVFFDDTVVVGDRDDKSVIHDAFEEV